MITGDSWYGPLTKEIQMHFCGWLDPLCGQASAPSE